jgi:nucleotide-binding universal stress UspA family protein
LVEDGSLTRPVLFCFDGSDGSLRALRDGGALLAPRAAVVLTVWEAVATQIASSGGFGFSYVPDEQALDMQEEAAARQAAERGVVTARSHGWEAVARVENARLTVWQTLVAVADEIDASLIVCGARGRNAIKRAVLGSVAEAVVHHSHRPALIAPEPNPAGL